MGAERALALLQRAERALGVALREVGAARDALRPRLEPERTAQEALDRLAAWLKAYRAEHGLTVEALAQRAGLSPSSVKNLERARHAPAPETLERLVRLGLPDDLRRLLGPSW